MHSLENTNFMFYTSDNGTTNIQVILDDKNETVWVSQNSMAEIFDTTKQTISYHINNIYKEGELNKFSTVKEILTVQKEGNRNVQRNIEFYNLDAIISVGYRVSSQKATMFRIWANSVLKNYLVKGFAIDDDRLKQGKNLFDKDYFDELIEIVREIRASERRFYQKVTDLYATAIDYNPKAEITRLFFATVQNKLEFAITHHTASEIIKLRANSKMPNMGLTSWKNEKKGGKILKSDVSVAKNYLKKEEISELNTLVNMYLDFAELQAKRGVTMTMEDWANKLDSFLSFNEYDLLKDAGRMRKEVAKKFAEKEYEKFRVIQDREYKSDFDRMVEGVKKGNIPKEKEIKIEEPLSDFNKKLKQGLNFNPKEEKPISALSLKSLKKKRDNKD
ncbi:virulence RhuM family protein [Snuella sedimenti]|uniref:Virulence RhuM family protein n=1 Tax=Snuella sedimenti TaxID=2798802 RepID=A0A8J7LMI9_9FLAO|nr:virulence RhuM family protein [Snuella sedimenti]MBJ6366763.1 virulence RhuM family protein [Snuella sedimenti]